MYQALKPSRSSTLPLRHLDYHVRHWGPEQSHLPTLVLVHGWMDVSASYQFTVDALQQERRIIAPDHQDRAFKAIGAQRERHLCSAMPGAHNHHISLRHVSNPLNLSRRIESSGRRVKRLLAAPLYQSCAQAAADDLAALVDQLRRQDDDAPARTAHASILGYVGRGIRARVEAGIRTLVHGVAPWVFGGAHAVHAPPARLVEKIGAVDYCTTPTTT